MTCTHVVPIKSKAEAICGPYPLLTLSAWPPHLQHMWCQSWRQCGEPPGRLLRHLGVVLQAWCISETTIGHTLNCTSHPRVTRHHNGGGREVYSTWVEQESLEVLDWFNEADAEATARYGTSFRKMDRWRVAFYLRKTSAIFMRSGKIKAEVKSQEMC